MRPLISDFFEVVNGFEEEPEDDDEGQYIKHSLQNIHIINFLNGLPKRCPKK